MISRLLPTALLVAVLTASQAGALEDFDPIGIAMNAGRAEQIARLCGISTRALEQAEIAYARKLGCRRKLISILREHGGLRR